MKHLIAAFLASFVLAGAAVAQTPDFGPPIPSAAVAGLDGAWEGGIQTPDGALTGIFRVQTTGEKTTTMMDSPMQGAMNIPAIAKRDGQKIVFEVPILGGDFTGELSTDGAQITGVWHQSGMELPFVLKRK